MYSYQSRRTACNGGASRRLPYNRNHTTRTFRICTAPRYLAQEQAIVGIHFSSPRHRGVGSERNGSERKLGSLHCYQSQRKFSSRRGDSTFQLDAIPFSVAPEDALAAFDRWARQDQGLTWLLQPRNVQITAAFCPVWSFDLNVRFVKQTGRSKDFSYKPPAFSVYGTQSVIHVPGLAAYAGYTYRRSLVDPLHNSALLFLDKHRQPFGQWMLRPMQLSSQGGPPIKLSVFPDPWNTPKARARGLILENLQGMVEEDQADIQVETQIVNSRRVYMPTFVIDYTVLGVTYQAFLSGCDRGAGVSGVSHRVLPEGAAFPQPPSQSATNTFLQQTWKWLNMAGGNSGAPRVIAGVLAAAWQTMAAVVGRIGLRLPIVGVIATAVIGLRKVLLPWWTQYESAADWERQREHESASQNHQFKNDFEDVTGKAQKYFSQNRERILRHLGGDRESGEYDWYKEWEEWARRQWSQQQQQQQHDHRQQRFGRSKQQTHASDYQWDFDKNDPYSVLGIPRGSPKKEVSAAFRREMLKWHPDTIEPGASAALRERATERSKLITEAYRKIKSGA